MKLDLLHNSASCLFYNKNSYYRSLSLGISKYTKLFYMYDKKLHAEAGIIVMEFIKLINLKNKYEHYY